MELDKRLLQEHVYDRTKSAIIFLDPDEKVFKHLKKLGYNPQRKRIYTILDLSQLPPSKAYELLDIRPTRKPVRNTDTPTRHQTPEVDTRHQLQTPVSAHKLFMNKRLLYEVLLNNISGMEYEMMQSLHSFLLSGGKECRVKRSIRLPKSLYDTLMGYIKAFNKKFNAELTFNDLVELTLPLWIEVLRKLISSSDTRG